MSSANFISSILSLSSSEIKLGGAGGGSGSGGRALLNPGLMVQEFLTAFMYPLNLDFSFSGASGPGTWLAAFGQSLKQKPRIHHLWHIVQMFFQ